MDLTKSVRSDGVIICYFVHCAIALTTIYYLWWFRLGLSDKDF